MVYNWKFDHGGFSGLIPWLIIDVEMKVTYAIAISLTYAHLLLARYKYWWIAYNTNTCTNRKWLNKEK